MKNSYITIFIVFVALTLPPYPLKAQTSNENKIVELWGMTSRGGANDKGVIFKFNLNSNTYTKVFEFDGTNGAEPKGSLLYASNGRFYGMTSKGGSDNSGVVFEYNPISDRYTYIALSRILGKNPNGSLIQASNGKLYGMTSDGGPTGQGNIFSLTINLNGGYGLSAQNLLSFNGTNGENPNGDFYQASNGLLYGMTDLGGVNGIGTIFYFSTSTNQIIKVKDLDVANGGRPLGSFIQATDGQLYGMMSRGGSSDLGVLFKFTTVGFTIHSYVKKFDFTTNTGGFPDGALVQASNGLLYGMTNSPATVFSFDFSSNQCNTLHTFADNTYTSGSLTLSSDGETLYGLTINGGTYGNGIIFKYDNEGRKVLFSFSPNNGINPIYTNVVEVTYADDADNDLVPDVYDECPRTPSGESVNENGCSESQLDDDNDGIINGLDICPDTPEGETANINGCSQSQITYVPDANFERALIDRGFDSDSIINQQVPTSDISEVIFLDVRYENIEDLTGIQNFTSLETLHCNSNKLFDLDVSQNKQLKYLGCGSNQLSELDVKQNINLETLDCKDNQLIILNVSQNSALVALDCVGNQIVELDVTQNKNIECLYCDDNNLTSLNLKNGNIYNFMFLNAANNPQLSCISVDDVERAYEVTELGAWYKDKTTIYSVDCSIKPDTDGDGVPDDIDYCNETPEGEEVDEYGCAQSQYDDDTDGAMNNVDICPNTPLDEFANSQGCSPSQLDSDNDGVMDNMDECPDTPQDELIDSKGCPVPVPDDDNDGIPNESDLCPNTPTDEAANAQGCSTSQIDSDNDGVMDNMDECSDTPQDELVNGKGCPIPVPDDDNDGSPNESDLCPNTPTDEAANAQGCSTSQIDSDNDGVMDNMDECSDTPQDELVDSKGCPVTVPDDDNDGIPNESDLCPNTSTDEAANAQGCSPSQIDSDDDGVMDNLDECPDTPLGIEVNESGCQLTPINYTAIPDSIFEQALIDLGIDTDKILNKKVATGDIAEIESLDVRNKNINDLTGIEEFISLTYLNCMENNLTELDVTNNTLLTHLNCNTNQLTELDVRNNTLLSYFNCSVNKITSLDLSNNSNLTGFYCTTNQLNSLNVKNKNNQTLTGFAALDNLMLNCIEVDNPFAANKGIGVYASWQKNAVASYSDDCTAEQDDDKDGILNKDDLCPATNVIIPVDSFGCPLQSTVVFSETFEDCEKVHFFSFNESSNKNWQCQDAYGEDNSGCMSMNGYQEDTPSKDWLITNSPIDFVSYAKEKLSFYVHAQYGSTQLRLLYSLDYDGFGNPANFSWDSVPNVSIPIHSTGTSEKEIHNFKGIDISAIPGEAYLAFQYYSNSNTTRWNVDNFIITADDDKDSDDDDDGIMNDVDVCNNTKRGERVNDAGCTVTGSSINKNSELNVYPNPTSNNIKITGLDDSKTNLIRLYDSLGKELINKEVFTTETEVDLVKLISGIYYILIRNEDASFSIKIIKN